MLLDDRSPGRALPSQRLTVFISQLASSDIPGTEKGQPTSSSMLSEHDDDDDGELLEEREPWTGWTTSSPDGSACPASSSLGSMISSQECWSASLSASAMGWGAGSGKFSMPNAGKLPSAPTSRSMFLYTAAPCFGATILPRNRSAKKWFRQTKLNRFPSPKAGQAEANTGGKGGGCSISKWRTPAARHGHVSLSYALASTHDAAKPPRW